MAETRRTCFNRGPVTDSILEELRGLRQRGMTLRDRIIEDAQLRGADLTGLRADRLTLREVDLRSATLRDVQWLDCRLEHVRLGGVVGRGAIMRMCVFDDVRAADGDLAGAKLEDCQALGIVLDRATLAGGSLVDTDLTRATLREANLRDVDASGATLRGADLRDADLRGASLVDVDLRGADLRGGLLEDADLDGADLSGAILDGADEGATDAEGAENAMPPPVADLVDAVGPLVVDVLRQGKQRGIVDEATVTRMITELGALGVPTSDATQAPTALSAPLLQILQRSSTTGIGRLIAALQHGGGQPPPEVAQLIRALADDANLGPDANADDLVQHLTGLLRSLVVPE